MPSNGSTAATGALLRDSPWKIQRRVIGALFLREMLTRYGRNNIGFLWLFVEPMLFTIVITVFWSETRTIHGGDNIPIVAFSLTGYSSSLLWRGVPARLAGALKSNRTLLFHRQVKVLDVYFARLGLEFMGTSTSFVILAIAMYASGWLTPPEDALQVTVGWLLLCWFSGGLSLSVAGLAERFDIVRKLWPPIAYFLVPLSGIAFIVDALPPKIQHIALYLPMLNALEYLREGWFGSLMHAHYDLAYVTIFNTVLTFTGLSLVRQSQLETEDDD